MSATHINGDRMQLPGSTLKPGEVICGFRIEGVLAEGGMATVYRATQGSLGRTVALKVLSRAFSDDAAFVERFRHEGRLQAAMRHPHIVPIYEAGQFEHNLFLAMHLIEGPTLKELIVTGQTDAILSVEILSQVADALDAAHALGMLHRDIKPQNVLIETGAHAYLADFGLAKDLNGASLTTDGQFIGTIDYVSPEQASCGKVTPCSDVYELAAVLYECLTGTVPYARPTQAAVLFAHLTEPPPSVTELRPDLPCELDRVIARGMAKDPAERHQTASELILEAGDALGASLARVPV